VEAEEMGIKLYQAFEKKYIESYWECHRRADDHQANLHISKNRQWAAQQFYATLDLWWDNHLTASKTVWC